MSVSTDIKTHIMTNIQSCASVQTVYGHEELQPSGIPAVMVTATDMDGEFSSNAQNSRIYAFRVQIFVPVGQDLPGQPAGTNRMEFAEQLIATVIDEIINVSDIDYRLTGSDTTVLYVNAADVSWGYVPIESGEYRTAQLTLRVYSEKTVV